MFALTLVDHLRLTFGHVIYSHRAHSQLALRHTRWSHALQAAEGMLVLTTAASAAGLLYTGDTAYAVGAAVAAALGLTALLLRYVFNFEASAGIHRTCSAHLWHLREQYRALLADLQDGSISLDVARERRDGLMQRLHRVYEHAPPCDRAAYEAAREALPSAHEMMLSDEEVDRFLPDSMRKSSRSAA